MSQTAAANSPDFGYEQIEAAVKETARGRQFLEEYGRRNRNTDTLAVMRALSTLHNALLSLHYQRNADKPLAPIQITPPPPLQEGWMAREQTIVRTTGVVRSLIEFLGLRQRDEKAVERIYEALDLIDRNTRIGAQRQIEAKALKEKADAIAAHLQQTAKPAQPRPAAASSAPAAASQAPAAASQAPQPQAQTGGPASVPRPLAAGPAAPQGVARDTSPNLTQHNAQLQASVAQAIGQGTGMETGAKAPPSAQPAASAPQAGSAPQATARTGMSAALPANEGSAKPEGSAKLESVPDLAKIASAGDFEAEKTSAQMVGEISPAVAGAEEGAPPPEGGEAEEGGARPLQVRVRQFAEKHGILATPAVSVPVFGKIKSHGTP